MMKHMSFSETIFLFVLALIIFGPKKLPEIARQIGKALNEFRRASNEFKAQIEHEITNLEVEERKKTTLAPSPTPDGTASRSLTAAPSEAPAVANAGEPTSADISPATLAASDDSVSATHEAQRATEALPASDLQESDLPASGLHASKSAVSEPVASEPVTSTQESHA
jgi:sec-independent protein translocase protein TatB